MATDSEITRLTDEIVNLKLAAHSFREAANKMRVQRDEARREARALRRRIRIVAAVMMMAVLLVVEFVVYDEAGETTLRPRLAKTNSTAAFASALHAVTPGAALSMLQSATDENGYLVYEVVVIGKDGQPHEELVDASSGKILQDAVGGKDAEENDE